MMSRSRFQGTEVTIVTGAFFEQWGNPSLLGRSGEDACEERCVDNMCEFW